MSSGKSWVSEHPWMTFFLGLAGLSAVVTLVRGYQPPPSRLTATLPLPKGFEASGSKGVG